MKTERNRIPALLLAALILCGCLAGCSSISAPAVQPPTAAPELPAATPAPEIPAAFPVTVKGDKFRAGFARAQIMPVASSHYWNSIHGGAPGEAAQDAEGLLTMRTLARNMAFLIKSIALGKEQFGLPTLDEETLWTNFVR